MLYEHSEVRRQQAREHAEQLARAYRPAPPVRAQEQVERQRTSLRTAIARLAHRPGAHQAPAPPA